MAGADPFAAAIDAHRSGRLTEAEAGYRAVLTAQPVHVPALLGLGLLAEQQGHLAAARALYAQAAARAPDNGIAHRAAAIVAKDAAPDEAAAGLRRALALDPADAIALAHLGDVERRRGRYEASHAAFARVQAVNGPADAAAGSNLATAEIAIGRVSDGILRLRRTVALAPGDGNALWNLATACLSVGDWDTGWRLYERRFDAPNHRLLLHPLRRPRWRGEPPDGRPLLVWSDQGIGDCLQFARFLPVLVAQGHQIVLECNPELVTLFQDMPGLAGVVARGGALPPVGRMVAISSLPWILRIRPDRLPGSPGFIRAPADRRAVWAARLADLPGPRVGIVWTGNAGYSDNANRSPQLPPFRPLLARRGVSFVSLQVGAARQQLDELPAQLRPTDFGRDITDFADTAAIAAQLDHIVTSDTSVAHLAGAMGLPVTILLPYIADWRWMRDTDRSPWYPSARLLRQTKPGDWQDLIMRALDEMTPFNSF